MVKNTRELGKQFAEWHAAVKGWGPVNEQDDSRLYERLKRIANKYLKMALAILEICEFFLSVLPNIKKLRYFLHSMRRQEIS